jgi:hypothetical protein
LFYLQLTTSHISSSFSSAAMNFNPNFEEIGMAFIAHYYQKFDVIDSTARTTGLSDLYDVSY